MFRKHSQMIQQSILLLSNKDLFKLDYRNKVVIKYCSYLGIEVIEQRPKFHFLSQNLLKAQSLFIGSIQDLLMCQLSSKLQKVNISIMSEPIQVIKLLLVGNSETGKTSILLRFVDDTFSESYLSTIGVDFRVRTIPIEEKQVKLQIWDTTGQARFRSITSNYFRGAHGTILVYSVASRSSFEAIRNEWLVEIRRNSNENAMKMLIGCKADLQEGREVSYEEGRDFANQLEIDFQQVSSKTNQNIEQAFFKLAQKCLSNTKN